MARIALVEDAQEIQKLIQLRLTLKNHQVETFDHGEKALKAIEANPPDLVILDVGLPGINGFQIAEALRSNSGTKKILILFLTSHADIESKVSGLQFADDYMTKPVQFRELDARVNALLRRVREGTSQPATPEASTGLWGRIEETGGAASVVQMVSQIYNSGCLKLGEEFRVYLDQGRVVHVSHPNLSPEQAASEMMMIKEGVFHFDQSQLATTHTLNLSPMSLALEAARRLDESQSPPKT